MADLFYKFKGDVLSFNYYGDNFAATAEDPSATFDTSMHYTSNPDVLTIQMQQDVKDGDELLCTLKTQTIITLPGFKGPLPDDQAISLIKVAMKWSMDNVVSLLQFEHGLTLDPVPDLPPDFSVLAALWSSTMPLN